MENELDDKIELIRELERRIILLTLKNRRLESGERVE